MEQNERKEQGPTKYIQVKEVMEICSVSETHAYRIMRRLNKELEAKGFVTTAGRVSRKYFMERLYI